MSLHPYTHVARPTPTTDLSTMHQGLEVVLAWKINDVTEELLSIESLLEHEV